MSINENNAPEERIVPLRLQKFLARAGVASRRGSENLMTAGRVTVNGEVVSELGSRVDPRCDVVAVDGMVVKWGSKPRTIALNKPLDCLTTMKDPQGRRCVASLIPTAEMPGIYPIGRLDRDTEGLLLFSTDGQLGNAVLHPSHHVDKTYMATVAGHVLPGQVERLCEGIMLDDGLTAPACVSIVEQGQNSCLLSITIHEGRKRQVRRMCSAIGHEVIALRRISFGPIELGDLPSGTWRELTAEEIQLLYDAAGLDARLTDLGTSEE